MVVFDVSISFCSQKKLLYLSNLSPVKSRKRDNALSTTTAQGKHALCYAITGKKGTNANGFSPK